MFFRRRSLLSENTRHLTAKEKPSDGEMGGTGEPEMEKVMEDLEKGKGD